MHAHTEAVFNDKVKQPEALCFVNRENFENLLDELYLARKERRIQLPTLCTKTVLPLLFLCLICPAKAMLVCSPDNLATTDMFIKIVSNVLFISLWIKLGRLPPWKLVFTMFFINMIGHVVALNDTDLVEQEKYLRYSSRRDLFGDDIIFFFVRIVGYVLLLCVIALCFYMIYRAGIRLYLWWTKPAQLYTINMNNGQVVWATTRLSSAARGFVDYRSQQRAARAAVTTRLVNVTFPGTEEPIPICLDLVATCLEHFTGSTPTKAAIMNYLYTQTQFNLNPLEWTQHKLYAPSMVAWMLRQDRNSKQ